MKQLTAYVRIAARRVKKEKADALALHTLAARGKEDLVKKQMKELQK